MMATEEGRKAEREKERKRLLAKLDRPDDFKPGTYGHHEALHTASVVLEIIETHLSTHPAVILHKEAYALADEAMSKVFALYQLLGQLDHEQERLSDLAQQEFEKEQIIIAGPKRPDKGKKG